MVINFSIIKIANLNQIIHHKTGSGLHGSVYRALWHGEFIAVKKFQSWDDESWRHELEIFRTQMISHRNILRVIAAASRDNGTATERWLVTEFHPHGSLYDYLRTHNRSLKPPQCLKLLNSCMLYFECSILDILSDVRR